jgi:hypothetical protein
MKFHSVGRDFFKGTSSCGRPCPPTTTCPVASLLPPAPCCPAGLSLSMSGHASSHHCCCPAAVTGSHYDEYNYEFTKFKAGPPADSVFDLPSICSEPELRESQHPLSRQAQALLPGSHAEHKGGWTHAACTSLGADPGGGTLCPGHATVWGSTQLLAARNAGCCSLLLTATGMRPSPRLWPLQTRRTTTCGLPFTSARTAALATTPLASPTSCALKPPCWPTTWRTPARKQARPGSGSCPCCRQQAELLPALTLQAACWPGCHMRVAAASRQRSTPHLEMRACRCACGDCSSTSDSSLLCPS